MDGMSSILELSGDGVFGGCFYIPTRDGTFRQGYIQRQGFSDEKKRVDDFQLILINLYFDSSPVHLPPFLNV